LRQSPSPQRDGSHSDDSLNLPLEKAHRSRLVVLCSTDSRYGQIESESERPIHFFQAHLALVGSGSFQKAQSTDRITSKGQVRQPELPRSFEILPAVSGKHEMKRKHAWVRSSPRGKSNDAPPVRSERAPSPHSYMRQSLADAVGCHGAGFDIFPAPGFKCGFQISTKQTTHGSLQIPLACKRSGLWLRIREFSGVCREISLRINVKRAI